MTKEIQKPDNLRIEDTRLIYRNFAGKPTKFNVLGGVRTVGVIIPDLPTAQLLERDGWNIKYLTSRDTGEIDAAYISAKISFENKPPKIVMISNKKQTPLDMDAISVLDYADIINVDVIVTPYVYDVMGAVGIAAYIKTLYVTIQPDEFAEKYEEEEVKEHLPFS